MKLFRTVLIYELIRQASRNAYKILTIGLPIAALVIFGLYFLISATVDDADQASEEESIEQLFEGYDPIGYIDPNSLLQEPTLPPFAELVTRYDNEAAARNALEENEIVTYFILNDDYIDTGSVDAIAESLNLRITEQVDLFEAFVLSSLITDQASAELFIRLQNPVSLSQNTIQRGAEGAERVDESDELQDFWVAYVFVLALIGSTLISSGYLMSSVIEERETRMIEILISSVRPGPLLAGKIVAQGILGLVQISTWIVTFLIIATHLAGDLLAIQDLSVEPYTLAITFIYFVLGYLLFGAAYAGIGAISGSLREGSQLLAVVILPAMAPVYVLAFLTEEPNGTLATVMSIVPITAPVTMVIRATLVTVPPLELAASILFLSATVAIFIWLSGRLFRVGVLLTGSFPGMRELLRYLTEKPQIS